MAPRITAVFPILASTAAVALIIVMLVYGTKPSNGDRNYLLSFNTSKLGSDVVEITPASTTTSSSSPSSTDALTSLESGIAGLLDGLINNITGAIDSAISDFSGQLVSNLTKELGVKDVYNFYVNRICEGSYTNPSDPNSAISISQCSAYNDDSQGLRHIAVSIPSYFIVANQNISVPLVSAISSSLTTTLNLVGGGAKAMLVLLIISCVAVGLTLLGSAAALILGFRRPLTVASAAVALTGGNVMLLLAIVATGFVAGGGHTINNFGGGLGMSARQGGAFLAEVWVAAVLAMAAAGFWLVVWLVEARHTAFARRWRTGRQIRNYRGIFAELMNDMKLPPRAEAFKGVPDKEGRGPKMGA